MTNNFEGGNRQEDSRDSETCRVEAEVKSRCMKLEEKMLFTLVEKKDKVQVEKCIQELSKNRENFEKVVNKLTVPQLIEIEDLFEGFLLLAFAETIDKADGTKSKPLSFEECKSIYGNPNSVSRIRVNFGDHALAESEIGMADMLPPSIRSVTLFRGGQPSNAVSSNFRVGLKGQNKDSEHRGFFYEGGYMAIFSGDIIVLQAADTSFERFGAQGRNLDYSAYDTSEEKRRDEGAYSALQEKYKSNPELLAPRNGPGNFRDPEEMRKYLEELNPDASELVAELNEKTSRAGALVCLAAIKAVQMENVSGLHCWDWVDKIYKLGNVHRRTTYQNLNYRGKIAPDTIRQTSNKLLPTLQAGDWLYFNNRNKYDTHGCHSGIFLGWENNVMGKAKIASCPGANRQGDIRTFDLRDMPVTHITKPV